MNINNLFDSLISVIPRLLNFLYEFKIYGSVNLLGVLIAFGVIGTLMSTFAPHRG